MSRNLTASLIFGMPISKAKFSTDAIAEGINDMAVYGLIGRFISYDSQDMDDQLVGIELHWCDWGCKTIDRQKLSEEYMAAYDAISVYFDNPQDLDLYLHGSYF